LVAGYLIGGKLHHRLIDNFGIAGLIVHQQHLDSLVIALGVKSRRTSWAGSASAVN
jgi:hypothetical protein